MADDPAVSASVRDVEWGEPLLPQLRDAKLEAEVRKGGPVQRSLDYFTPVPWAYRTMARLNRSLLQRVALDHDLADLAGLVVSQDNSCRYCFAVQRALLRTVGFAEERIERIEETLLLSDLSRRERTALEFARRFSRSNPLVGARELETLREAGFDGAEIRDLTVVCALLVFFNRTATLLAIPPYGWEKAPDRWYAPLVRPLIAPFIRRNVRRRVEPTALREDQKSGPFSYLTNALDGHPVAGALRESLDEMWESPHLSRRGKLLCFAVVARALSCPPSQEEARSLLAAEGLDESELGAILANLSSPGLDATEARVVPFSRQTVWYQVPDLQRRARELREALPDEAFIEAILATSLANLVCRLGFLAAPDA